MVLVILSAFSASGLSCALCNLVAQRLRLSCARYTAPSSTPAIAHLCDETTRLARPSCVAYRTPISTMLDADTPFAGASLSALQNAYATRTTSCDTDAPPTTPRASRGMTAVRVSKSSHFPVANVPFGEG